MTTKTLRTARRSFPKARYGVAIAAMALLAGCDTPQTAPTSDALSRATPSPGYTKASAIEACRPEGQRAYLSRLACASGERLSLNRIGSFGPRNPSPMDAPPAPSDVKLDPATRPQPAQPGTVDEHIVDGYEVLCGKTRRVVYIDMYHCDQPQSYALPEGFVWKNPAPAPVPAPPSAPARRGR